VFFAGSSAIALVSFAVTGVIDAEAVWLFLAAVPGVIVASWAGHQINHRIEPAAFRRLVFGLLFALAGVAMASALVGLVG
jgi:uncharacterized membrane protein YfcA